MSLSTAAPSASPRAAGLAAGAERAAAVAARHAEAADAARRLPPEVLDALVTAGFARHFVPAAHGGTQGTFTELAHALTTVGGGCVSAAWVALIHASSARMAAFLPAAGRDEVWADGPDVPVSSALRPAGEATRAGDDWVVSGRWDFLSGVASSDWSLLCVAGERCEGGRPGETRYFAVPRRACAVEETWCPSGMRATASDSLRADGVRVPAARTFLHTALLSGSADPDAAACHRTPLQACSPPLFVAPALGAADRALTAWARGRAKRDATARLALARGTAELDIARLLLDRSVAAADAVEAEPGSVARTLRDAAVAARLVRDALDRIVDLSGSALLTETDPLQRAWRDVRTATAHGALDLDRNSAQYARDAWGWEP
ncbi:MULTISPECIES: acyl-CoA dehydrogenase family protein [Streptomyces]|uniref:acyl-CoA dehydrogenase family protein n=1 Tax=Streptomyces TaxID=1883 RepID=UPI00163C6BF0|nr:MULTISPECIES: acyl-CoA dehydrogenase family protein [Streptomyces]MBC2876904.1 hydrolase [Streptomyces sp. TYQ1024]UBI35931.1 hydrolase [Streptomyces mobaraensis]UKW28524.1 hydrolase [Streptomyces sp. TYQ1024]